MTQREKYAEKLTRLSTESVKRRYFIAPFLNIFADAVTLAIFISAFFMQKTEIMLAMLGIGVVAVIICARFFPSYKRSYLAAELCSRNLEDITASGIMMVAGAFARILRVCNYLFSILSAFIVLVISLIIALVVGGVSCIAYVVFSAAHANGAASAMLRLAMLSTIPAKLTMKFFFYALFANPTPKQEKRHGSDIYGQPFETDPQKMGRTLSELQIDRYLSLSGASLAPNCQWASPPDLSAYQSDVYVRGTIVCDKICYHDQNDIRQATDETAANVRDHLQRQIDHFLRDYPNASGAKLHIEIDGYIG